MIAVMDSRTYGDDLTIEVRAGSRLLIVAADWPADEDPDRSAGADAAASAGCSPAAAGRTSAERSRCAACRARRTSSRAS